MKKIRTYKSIFLECSDLKEFEDLQNWLSVEGLEDFGQFSKELLTIELHGLDEEEFDYVYRHLKI